MPALRTGFCQKLNPKPGAIFVFIEKLKIANWPSRKEWSKFFYGAQPER